MDTVEKQILSRLAQAEPGWVFTPKDFLDRASRDATDQALSRLVRAGRLKRLGRGLYYAPRQNAGLGLSVPPDLDDVAEAIARQTGCRVAPSGAVAANRLGLSTQVSAKPVYITDGRTRQVRAGKYLIQIKHVAPKEMPQGSRTSAQVFQALRFLGKDAMGGEIVKTLRRSLSKDQKLTLLQDARYAADWMADVARQVAAGEVAHG